MAPKLPDVPNDLDLTGYTVLVTGSNTGIGLENARQYLQCKASPVYLAVRNVEKGNEAKRLLLEDPVIQKENPRAIIEVYQLDLSSFDSVIEFAKRFSAEVPRLNIAVLNAGVSYFKYVPTVNNYETVFQVNYMSNVLLASRLIPLLKAGYEHRGKPSHLGIVSSKMQHMTPFGKKKIIQDDQDIVQYLNDKNNMSMDRYNVSKLLVTAYVVELAKHLDSKEVIVNSMCPGLVNTNFDVNSPFWLKYPLKLIRHVSGRTPFEGAQALTLATITGTEGHGRFFSDGKDWPIAPWLLTEEGKLFQTRLYNETNMTLAKIDPSGPLNTTSSVSI